MLKKTHLAVGTATSLCVLQPASIKELVLGTGVAMLGSVISDMDSEMTKSNHFMDWMVTIISLSVIAVAAGSALGKINIWDWIQREFVMTPSVLAGIIFFIICAFGKEQSHRSFLHSFLGLFALYACVEAVFPVEAPYFGVAFTTHIVLDLLNRKGMTLFYPIKKRFCLNLCSSSGWLNNRLLKLGMWVGVIAFGYRAISVLF